jgi:hypothetical protein
MALAFFGGSLIRNAKGGADTIKLADADGAAKLRLNRWLEGPTGLVGIGLAGLDEPIPEVGATFAGMAMAVVGEGDGTRVVKATAEEIGGGAVNG